MSASEATVNDRTREVIFSSLVTLITLANHRGEYFVEPFSETLNHRLIGWYDTLCKVEATDQASMLPLVRRNGEIVEIVIRVRSAPDEYYLRWLRLRQKWGLVKPDPETDRVSFETVTTDPEEIAREIVGGMLTASLAATNDAAYLPGEKSPLREGRCFLCNERDADTDEHVFPRWLQNEFDLWHKQVGLLNDTLFRYKSLIVPACQRCNTDQLGNHIEKIVAEAYQEGYHSFKHLSEKTLFQWVGKIFLGLLVKETQLKLDRSDPNSTDKIMERSLFKGVNVLREWLSSIYRPVEFEKPHPWVVYVARVDDQAIQFNYADSIPELTFMLQLGGIGIIAVAMDHLVPRKRAGMHEPEFERLTRRAHGRLIEDQIRDRLLHPAQLIELFVRVTHEHSLASLPPAFGFHQPTGAGLYDRLRVLNTPVPFEMGDWDEDFIAKGTGHIAGAVGIDTRGSSYLMDENSDFVSFYE